MATFTVGYLSQNAGGSFRGQSFNPGVAGQGSGSLGTAKIIYLTQVDFGYSSSSTAHRSSTLYLYDFLPTITNLNSGTGALDASSGYQDGNVFNTGEYSRSFAFGRTALDPTKLYYLLFTAYNTLAYTNSDVYSGGDVYSPALVAAPYDAEFRVTMSDT